MRMHRTFMGFALAGSALLAAGALSPSFAAEAVTVIVSPHASEGVGPGAVRIRAAMEHQLSGALGAALRSRGERLVVTVNSVMMASSAGGDGHRGSSDLDGMDSTATVIGPHGGVVASIPIVSSVSADAAGPWYATDNIGLRIDSLALNNASWIERYVAQ
jgi:hypothetical protein